jgi:hypothetical protein
VIIVPPFDLPIKLFFHSKHIISNFGWHVSFAIFIDSPQMVYISAIYVRLLVHALWMSISTQQFKLMMFNHVMPMWKALGFFHFSNWRKMTSL